MLRARVRDQPNEKGKLKGSVLPATDMHGDVQYWLRGRIKKAKVKEEASK